jgi:hypothetical protein
MIQYLALLPQRLAVEAAVGQAPAQATAAPVAAVELAKPEGLEILQAPLRLKGIMVAAAQTLHQITGWAAVVVRLLLAQMEVEVAAETGAQARHLLFPAAALLMLAAVAAGLMPTQGLVVPVAVVMQEA